MACNCCAETYCCHRVVQGNCYGVRTFLGPFIDEPIVAILDRVLGFFGIKVSKPSSCENLLPPANEATVCHREMADSIKINQRFCQGTSTTSLCPTDVFEPCCFSNIQDSITYLKGCLKRNNSDSSVCSNKVQKTVCIDNGLPESCKKPMSEKKCGELNKNLEDLPDIRICSEGCMKANKEKCCNCQKYNKARVFIPRSNKAQQNASIKANYATKVFEKDSLPFIPVLAAPTYSVKKNTSQTSFLTAKTSGCPIKRNISTSSKLLCAPDKCPPERDKSIKKKSPQRMSCGSSPELNASEVPSEAEIMKKCLARVLLPSRDNPSVPSPPIKKESRGKKKLRKIANNMPMSPTGQQFATCLINSFPNNSKTYQIVQSKTQPTEIDEENTLMCFAELPNGSVITYTPS